MAITWTLKQNSVSPRSGHFGLLLNAFDILTTDTGGTTIIGVIRYMFGTGLYPYPLRLRCPWVQLRLWKTYPRYTREIP
jgi:hypothetical protein